jgi:hypothetical protein
MYDVGVIRLGFVPHGGKELTGRYMYHFAEDYANDLGGYLRMPFPAWYSRVQDIPYKSDDDLFPDEPGRVVEVVARPSYLLSRRMFPALDCKKKAILCGAWAAGNGRPFCFVASSELPSKQIHHVFPVIDFGRGLETADATFPGYRLGQAFPITYAEELPR